MSAIKGFPEHMVWFRPVQGVIAEGAYVRSKGSLRKPVSAGIRGKDLMLHRPRHRTSTGNAATGG